MGDYIKTRKFIYFLIGFVLVIFFLIVGILQIFLKDKDVKMANGTISQLKENTNLIEKIYLEWWNSSLNKVSSQGVKDIYEIKNTYESLNIIVKDRNVLRDVILNEIIIDGTPLLNYDFEVVETKDGKSIFKIPISEFSENNTNKLTEVITVYNRYDNIFYNIEIDSFEFRFSFSKDSNFLYLNFENYISNFYDKEFKVETSYYSDNSQNFIYSFGHVNKNVKIPIVNNLKVSLESKDVDTFFKENTSFTLYNRFGNPFITIGVLNSSELRVINNYNLSNVYDIELKDQVFVFESNEDNIFKISKREDDSVDIINLIDNYKIYFDENMMKTYKLYEDEGEIDDENLINFRIYRDLRDGNYVFAPNKSIGLYRFYDFKEDKFLSYNEETNKFVDKEIGSKFVITNDNKIFDISNRVFLKRDEGNNKNYFYIGDSNFENGHVFEFNNMTSSLFKKVSYDEIQKEIVSGNYIQVLLKNKETDEFLSVDLKSSEAINQTLYNDSYLNIKFNYNKGVSDLSNFLFEIRPYNNELTSFNLYSKATGTSLNSDYGFLNNKLIFDKNNDNKVRFVLEKNDGRDNEFKIKDDYGSYLAFDESDNFAKVTSSGFLKKFFNVEDNFDVFEIYMVDFETLEDINSGFYISFSSKKPKDEVFLNKVTLEDKHQSLKSIDEYIVLKNKEFLFLSGDNLIEDMVVTTNYGNLKGIEKTLISIRNEDHLGYRFRILNGINNTKDIDFKFQD